MSQEGNRLTRIFTEEEHADVKSTIKSVVTKVTPFTVRIDEAEISGFNKIGDGDKGFISDCLSEGKEAAELLPPSFSIESIKVSDTLHDQLYELEDALFDAYQHVRRNRMLAGSEASSAVSTFYALIKAMGTGKNKFTAAINMFNRLQGYYLKRLENSKAKKRKAEAEKLTAEKARASEKALATA